MCNSLIDWFFGAERDERQQYLDEIMGYYKANQGAEAASDQGFLYKYLYGYQALVNKGLVSRADLMECVRDKISHKDLTLYKFLGSNGYAISRLMNASESIKFSDICDYAYENRPVLEELFNNTSAAVNLIQMHDATLDQFVDVRHFNTKYILKNHKTLGEYISKGYIKSFDTLIKYMDDDDAFDYLKTAVDSKYKVIKLYDSIGLDFEQWMNLGDDALPVLNDNSVAIGFHEAFSKHGIYSELIQNEITTPGEMLEIALHNPELFLKIGESQDSVAIDTLLHEYRMQNSPDYIDYAPEYPISEDGHIVFDAAKEFIAWAYDSVKSTIEEFSVEEILNQRVEEQDLHNDFNHF